MKKLALALSLVAALSMPAFGQEQKAPEAERTKKGLDATPEQRAKRLQGELGLNDEQTAKVKAVYEKNQEKFAAVRNDTGISDETRRTQFRDLMRATAEEITPILTPEQKKKFLESRYRRRGEKAGEKK